MTQADGDGETLVLRIEVTHDSEWQYVASFTSADGQTAGCGDASCTLVGALANLCATLIKLDEL